jgi:hypothetical protein
MSSGFHFPGSLQHLRADLGEAAGSRQAIDQSNVERSLQCGQPTADRGVVHFQVACSPRERAALRHRQEMPYVLPVDHLCTISEITRTYIQFSHGCPGPIQRNGGCKK